MLLPHEQWDLHEYYRFTEQLSEDQLHQHWRSVQAAGSSLPHRAGRAYAAFQPFLVDEPIRIVVQPPVSSAKRRQVKAVQIKSLVRPEIDIEKLARVLLQIADQPDE
jgi:hypothetical protein